MIFWGATVPAMSRQISKIYFVWRPGITEVVRTLNLISNYIRDIIEKDGLHDK